MRLKAGEVGNRFQQKQNLVIVSLCPLRFLLGWLWKLPRLMGVLGVKMALHLLRRNDQVSVLLCHRLTTLLCGSKLRMYF